MLFEVSGGASPHTAAQIAYYSRRTAGKNARDSTKYGSSRTSTKSFFVHHLQRMSVAAQVWDAKGIRGSVRALKQHLAAEGSARAAP